MAELKVEVTSKDMIKPSSPTPSHLKTLKLSFIDQLAPPFHMPIILYYENPTLSTTMKQSEDINTLLKKALSHTLVSFYPLAGTVEGNTSINCNDEGVEFYEASVLNNLAEVLRDPNLDELVKLLPFPAFHDDKVMVAGIQVNHFLCGGVAIGVCQSHKIVDASTSAAFLTAWARNAAEGDLRVRTGVDTISPRFEWASLFPPREMPVSKSTLLEKDKRVVTQRVVFNKEQIKGLKTQVVLGLGSLETKGTLTPSKSLVVSAFVWKRFIEVAKTKPNPPKLIGARQAISFRTIPSSCVSKNSMGNLYTLTPVASAGVGVDNNVVYVQLVAKLKKSTQDVVDLNFFERLQKGENVRALPREYSEDRAPGDVKICGFGSLVWFPFYEIDFGWGKPVWVSLTSRPFMNETTLMPTKCGEGIEAWVSLEEDYVSCFGKEMCPSILLG